MIVQGRSVRGKFECIGKKKTFGKDVSIIYIILGLVTKSPGWVVSMLEILFSSCVISEYRSLFLANFLIFAI